MFSGAIFHKGDEDLRKIFVRAIAETKHENLAPAFELVPVIEDVDDNTDSFKTAAAGEFKNKKKKLIVSNENYAILSVNLLSNNFDMQNFLIFF